MTSNKNIYWILTILSVAGCAWIGFHLLAGTGNSATLCLFKNLTTIPCPSCGVTRSVLLFIRGDVYGALLMNPLGFVAAPALVAVPVWMIADAMAAKSTLAQAFLWTEKKIKTKKGIYMPLVALALLNWGWNIIKEL